MSRPETATVDIALEDPRWEAIALPRIAGRAVTASLARLGLAADAFEVSLLACDDDRITDLNTAFRDKPGPTNVLSWPAAERAAGTPGTRPQLPDPDDPMQSELGDIAIAFDTCQREATAAGIAFEAHVTHLLVHGTLHLLGFDHISDADADLMEGLEVEILATLDLPDPYGRTVL